MAYAGHFTWIDGIVIECDSVRLEEHFGVFKNTLLTKEKVGIVKEKLLPLIIETSLILYSTQWRN
jgi:hypothetical protein